MAKEVAKATKETEKALVYDNTSGRGWDNQTDDDMATPMVLVLQSLSPTVTKKLVPGAEPGKLFNNVTEELHDELLFVPAITDQVYVERTPRAEGGAFVAVHDMLSDTVQDAIAKNDGVKRDLKLGNNMLVQTFQIWGVLVDQHEALGFAMIPCASMKAKAYRTWNSKLRMYRHTLPNGDKMKPDLWAHLTRVSTIFTEGNKGDFYNIVLKPAVDGDVRKSLLAQDDPRFIAGEECYQMYKEQSLKPGAYEKSPDEDAADDKPPF